MDAVIVVSSTMVSGAIVMLLPSVSEGDGTSVVK